MIESASARNKLIDSTRGICITMVVLYHFNFLSFFDHNGMYGVLVFFIISGYCMVNSIQTSKHLLNFLKKRLFRLLPALVICAFITTLIKYFFFDLYPENFTSFSDYLKTVFFLPFLNIPSKFFDLIKPGFNTYKLVDGSYWSLVVEIKFYYLLGVIFFFLSRKYFPILLLVITICLAVLLRIQIGLNFSIPSLIIDFGEYLPYFIIGIGINKIHFEDKKQGIILVTSSVLALLVFYLLRLQAFSLPFTANAFIIMIFATLWIYSIKHISITNKYLNNLFSILAFVGKISYPLYLLHQEMGLILIKYLSLNLNLLTSKFLVVFFLLFLSYIISIYFENILQIKSQSKKQTL